MHDSRRGSGVENVFLEMSTFSIFEFNAVPGDSADTGENAAGELFSGKLVAVLVISLQKKLGELEIVEENSSAPISKGFDSSSLAGSATPDGTKPAAIDGLKPKLNPRLIAPIEPALLGIPPKSKHPPDITFADIGGKAEVAVVVRNAAVAPTPKEVGAFADIGGNAADADFAAGVLAPPKGVGAFADIGGNAADADAAVGFAAGVAPPPKGVGAFADIGGNAADAAVVGVFLKGVGAFADIGGNAADTALDVFDAPLQVVGAFVDIGATTDVLSFEVNVAVVDNPT